MANEWNWRDAGAPSIDFIATLPTVDLHLQRPLRSRQIEELYNRTQPSGVVHSQNSYDCNRCSPVSELPVANVSNADRTLPIE
ncbi:MAG: hypothetical protein ACYC4S_02920 [Rhodoferax sp.]